MNKYLLFIFSLLLSKHRIGFVRMLSIGNSLLSKLKVEPVNDEITKLIIRLQAILNLYREGIANWRTDKSRTRGKVDAFTKLMLMIPFIVDTFRTDVKIAMPGNKNVLLVLFGNNISVFYTGSQSEIIQTFTNLYNLLSDYDELVDLKPKVADFITKLKAAYDSKTDIKENVKIDSEIISNLHSQLGSVVLGSFGILLNEFRDNPYKVERFFESSMMRNNKKDKELTRSNEAWVDIEPDITINAANVKMIKNGYLVFDSRIDAVVCVYTASTSDSPVPALAFEIPANEKVGAKVSNLGSNLNDFLLFRVKTGQKSGRIKVSWRKMK